MLIYVLIISVELLLAMFQEVTRYLKKTGAGAILFISTQTPE